MKKKTGGKGAQKRLSNPPGAIMSDYNTGMATIWHPPGLPGGAGDGSGAVSLARGTGQILGRYQKIQQLRCPFTIRNG